MCLLMDCQLPESRGLVSLQMPPLRAYSIIECGFGFTLNLVSDSVKKCIRITNPNLDSDSVKPACKSISIE